MTGALLLAALASWLLALCVAPAAGAEPAPSPALVEPHPSIAGTPAPRNWVSCEAGLPEGAEAALGYEWLRDLAPIPYATGQRYYVKPRDGGHHLQCRVTATTAAGSVTRTSEFANVPLEQVPAAIGETVVSEVGTRGSWVNARIECSPHAVGRCQIEMRLTVVESRRGGRIVAVTAHRRACCARTANTRHLTVTVGEARGQLPRGQHRMLHVRLDAAGRELLRSRPHRILPVKLTVTGTVIGVLSATLAEEPVTMRLSGQTAPSAKHAARGARVLAAYAPPRSRATVSRQEGEEENPLAVTPYMGWDTFFAFGGLYSESSVLSEASEMVQLGLVSRGYRYVWLDSGWWQGQRAADGQILLNREQWPHGMRWLAQTLHAAGMKLGVYTDAGREGCGGAGQGSFDHYRQDANTFASWEVDAIKVDFCGGSRMRLDPKAAYTAFHEAVEANREHRPMLLSICDYLQPGGLPSGGPPFGESVFAAYTFGPSIAGSWRTDTDVGRPGHVTFAHVLRNLDADATHPEAAGPGHWNDPDYLGPGQGLTAAQFRTQFSMWAMLAAPLMISARLERLSPAELATVRNREAIAIDQDPAGVQGTLVESSGEAQVWVKPLLDGSRAVALLNRGASPVEISTTAAAVGMPQAQRYELRDIWARTETSTTEAIAAEVPPYSTVLLRVSAQR